MSQLGASTPGTPSLEAGTIVSMGAGARLSTDNLGFLLAKASQRWNELLYERFRRAGFGEVRASYGSILLPLFEEDGLRMGDLARRARLSKQTLTTMIRLMERDGLIERRADEQDRRAARIFLTSRARDFHPVAARAVAELAGLANRAVAGDALSLSAALRAIMGLPLGTETQPTSVSSGPPIPPTVGLPS